MAKLRTFDDLFTNAPEGVVVLDENLCLRKLGEDRYALINLHRGSQTEGTASEILLELCRIQTNDSVEEVTGLLGKLISRLFWGMTVLVVLPALLLGTYAVTQLEQSMTRGFDFASPSLETETILSWIDGLAYFWYFWIFVAVVPSLAYALYSFYRASRKPANWQGITNRQTINSIYEASDFGSGRRMAIRATLRRKDSLLSIVILVTFLPVIAVDFFSEDGAGIITIAGLILLFSLRLLRKVFLYCGQVVGLLPKNTVRKRKLRAGRYKALRQRVAEDCGALKQGIFTGDLLSALLRLRRCSLLFWAGGRD